ncbi:HNH endonuclease [Salmonella enterica]
MISKEELRRMFDYREDGNLIWKPREGDEHFNKIFAGTVAGSRQSTGHRVVELYNGSIAIGAHRLIYAWHTGEWPEIVDHKDKDSTNDRFENLRPATRSDNACNQKVRSDNHLGVKNIHRKTNGTYQVRITKHGKQVSKTLKSLEEAIKWRDTKLKELHGEFASTG